MYYYFLVFLFLGYVAENCKVNYAQKCPTISACNNFKNILYVDHAYGPQIASGVDKSKGNENIAAGKFKNHQRES